MDSNEVVHQTRSALALTLTRVTPRRRQRDRVAVDVHHHEYVQFERLYGLAGVPISQSARRRAGVR